MTTIAITNLKGGTAKTTSSILLAEGLRRLGHMPLILDADPQASASEWADTALEKKTPLKFEIQPANIQSIKRTAVADADIIIIDCPPTNPKIIDVAIKAADLVIIPVSPSGIEVSRMWESIDSAKGTNYGVLLTSVLANTKTYDELIKELDKEEVPVYGTKIPQRQGIKRLWGTNISGELYGYQYLAAEILGND